MAKDKKPQKGNGGGKQNAIRFGNVAAATAASEAGRARKRNDRHARSANRQTFAELVASASTDEQLLVDALDGSREGELIALDLETETEAGKVSGTVVIQIDVLGVQPAAWVRASNYSFIKAHVEWRLPLYTLMVKGYQSQHWNPELRAWLNELATTLQVVCDVAINARRDAMRALKASPRVDHGSSGRNVQKIVAPQLGRSEPLSAVVTSTPSRPKVQSLTWQHISGEVGYWKHDAPIRDGESLVGFVYLKQWTVAGARKFILTGVTGSHPLRSAWERVGKEEVQVDIAQVFPKGLVTATNFEDTPMRAARRELARYLKERYDELKALDPASAVSVPATLLEYDPLEVRGIYEQQFRSS